ncbi:MAG: hypothetical protein U0Y96_10535 [Candidatus Kapaibacterium sp.]
MNRIARLALGICAMLTASAVAPAQNINNGTCGKINNSGTIRLRSNTGQFQNAAPVAQVNNTNGTIEMTGTNNVFNGSNPLGSSASNRITGIVLWSSTNPAQNVQGRWYNNLNLSGNTKNMRDSIFVGGAYQITNGTGNRTYNGTFTYDGTIAQVVIPESGVNSYNNVELQNSSAGNSKTLSNGTANVLGTFTNNANNLGGFTVQNSGVLNLNAASLSNAPFTVNGNGSVINIATDNAYLTLGNNSTLLADNSGRINISSNHAPAAMAVGSGSTLRLGNTGNGGILYLTGVANMNIEGTYVNQLPSLTNAFYDCGTTVRYMAVANGQVIQATSSVEANRYGKLETIGGNKTTNGNVHVKCGLLVNPNSTVHSITVPATNTLYVYNGNPLSITPVRYDTTLNDCQTSSEVIGNMQIEMPASVANNSITFNNRFTTLQYTNAANVPQFVTFNSIPGSAPFNFNPTTDVQRKINVSYSNPVSGTPNWAATVKAGFRPAEAAGMSGLASLSNVRTFNSPAGFSPNMIGNNYQRSINNGCELYWISAQQISHTGTNTLASGSDLLLRGGPGIVHSSNDGRWSNPGTWATGSEPFPFDTVFVHHNVWAGFTRPLANGWDGYSTPEAFPNAMAASVTIDNNPPAQPNAALIFGLDQTAPANNGLFIIGGSSVYTASTVGTNGILRLVDCDQSVIPMNTTATDFNQFATVVTNVQPKANGLLIFAAPGALQPRVRVNDVQNAGMIQNGSTLEIGD